MKQSGDMKSTNTKKKKIKIVIEKRAHFAFTCEAFLTYKNFSLFVKSIECMQPNERMNDFL